MIKKRFRGVIFELYTLKAKIKGVFNRPYYYFGNLLYHEDDYNLLNNDCAFMWYQYCNIPWQRELVLTSQSATAGKNEKLLPATLN